ncbi:DUF664 domain-containing protein [Streptosporangium sp. NPDC006930]|uniref:mycothiol transferase n=1 Tax=unclassified Streptosporangium TaxID=2632669 RepID=UPI0034338B0D
MDGRAGRRPPPDRDRTRRAHRRGHRPRPPHPPHRLTRRPAPNEGRRPLLPSTTRRTTRRDGRGDTPPPRTAPDRPAPSVRWALAHMIEETGRHAGHADILRELIDGTTGR